MKITVLRAVIFALALLPMACSKKCGRNCLNENPVFDKYQPGSEAYKEELVNELFEGSEFAFFIDRYVPETRTTAFMLKSSGRNCVPSA